MKELENQKLELVETDKRHQETISKLERKFFEDKIRLQKEANRKISELAANAHRVIVVFGFTLFRRRSLTSKRLQRKFSKRIKECPRH